MSVCVVCTRCTGPQLIKKCLLQPFRPTVVHVCVCVRICTFAKWKWIKFREYFLRRIAVFRIIEIHRARADSIRPEPEPLTIFAKASRSPNQTDSWKIRNKNGVFFFSQKTSLIGVGALNNVSKLAVACIFRQVTGFCALRTTGLHENKNVAWLHWHSEQI